VHSPFVIIRRCPSGAAGRHPTRCESLSKVEGGFRGQRKRRQWQQVLVQDRLSLTKDSSDPRAGVPGKVLM